MLKAICFFCKFWFAAGYRTWITWNAKMLSQMDPQSVLSRKRFLAFETSELRSGIDIILIFRTTRLKSSRQDISEGQILFYFDRFCLLGIPQVVLLVEGKSWNLWEWFGMLIWSGFLKRQRWNNFLCSKDVCLIIWTVFAKIRGLCII